MELVEEYSIDLPLDKIQKKRKLTLQILYYLDVTNDVLSTKLGTSNFTEDDSSLSIKVIDNCRERALNIFEDKEILDHVIQTFAEEYPISQLSIIDKSLLRLAFWEIKNRVYEGNKSKLVEDFEKLGYLFGSDNSNKFIKGVIKSLIKKINKILMSIIFIFSG